MDYKHIDGLVYSRYASTPPVINSDLAFQYGIKVPCIVEPGQFSGFEVGKNVKLRLVVASGAKKLTCHAKIDWVKRDESTDEYYVGFGNLSLTGEEFQVLQSSFVEEKGKVLEFGVRVRDRAKEAKPVVVSDTAREIMRLKAVNFPVSIIEAIDEKRGSVSFSEFVTNAVREYLKD
ncbi:MAG: hypothetical protein ACLP5H_24545 [Desulfomonilaceae bacterium]